MSTLNPILSTAKMVLMQSQVQRYSCKEEGHDVCFYQISVRSNKTLKIIRKKLIELIINLSIFQSIANMLKDEDCATYWFKSKPRKIEFRLHRYTFLNPYNIPLSTLFDVLHVYR